MNRIIITLLLLIPFAFLTAQRPLQERIEAQRTAHITDALKLTAKESREFWPLYNEFLEEQEKLRTSKISRSFTRDNVKEMTDEEARQQIQSMLDTEEAMVKLKRKYYDDFMKVLSPAKVALLPEAERSFREMMVRRVSDRIREREQPAGRWRRN
jgi:hypothetical protein